jgi:selenocysteine-specific elongation factor
MEQGDPATRLESLTLQGEAPLSALVARTGWLPDEVLRVARTLETQNRATLLGRPPSALVCRPLLERLTKRVVEQLEKFHAANPLMVGIPKEDLRAKIAGGPTHGPLPSPLLFNLLLQTLSAQGKVEVQGELVRAGGQRIQLTPEETAAQEQISAAFERAGLAVPNPEEVLAKLRIDRARAEKLLQILLKESVLVKVAEDLIFHRSALTKLRELVAQRKAQSNRINVAVFKELTGLSRKFASPLLEYLDRARITRREGDERIIL